VTNEQHTYLPSGWCSCGHHRNDGRRDRDPVERPTLAQIRQILAAHTPKDTP
jgi:hypothetical protein